MLLTSNDQPSRSGTCFTIGSTVCSPPRGLCAASKYEQDARAVLAEKPLLGPVDHVSLCLTRAILAREQPHYHIVLWHVPKADEIRVAK